MIINKAGHMTKMAAMPIYGKAPSKIFFTGTAEPLVKQVCWYISQISGERYWTIGPLVSIDTGTRTCCFT